MRYVDYPPNLYKKMLCIQSIIDRNLRHDSKINIDRDIGQLKLAENNRINFTPVSAITIKNISFFDNFEAIFLCTQLPDISIAST